MKIKRGGVGFHVAYKVPNNKTQMMESFLDSHENFMRETHHIEGTVEPVVLCYAVLKSPSDLNVIFNCQILGLLPRDSGSMTNSECYKMM